MTAIYFLGGVHGAGKTVLSRELAPRVGGIALAASELIREEGVEPSTPDKRVADIDGNQTRLLRALAKREGRHKTILLDGHFCLRNAQGVSEPIPLLVFRQIAPKGLLLLLDDPAEIAARLAQRDSQRYAGDEIADLLACEVKTARQVSEALRIPLREIRRPQAIEDAERFIASLAP